MAHACARAFVRSLLDQGLSLHDLTRRQPQDAGMDCGAQIGGALWHIVAPG